MTEPRPASKSQRVRVLDVLVLGPFMVWAASQWELPRWARTGLAIGGVATILYNAENYLEEIKRRV